MNRFFYRFNGTDQPMIAAIDVAKTEDAIEVSVDVPGVDQDDLDVSLLYERLVIRGTKSHER